jgi:chromosome segregation ATPase
MTTPIENLTTEISQLEARLPDLHAEYCNLDAQAVDLQRRAAAGDTDAASQLTASRQRRAMAKLEHDDLTAALKVAKRELAEAQTAAAKADAAGALPRLAELHVSVPDLFAKLEAGVAAVVEAQRALAALESEAFTATYAAARTLGLSRDELSFRRTLTRDLAQAMLNSALAGRPFNDEQPAARLQGAIWQACRELADETGADMPGVAA